MGWKLAQLDEKQLKFVHEAEASLHMDYLLAFAPADADAAPGVPAELRPAKLSDSEIECLQGMEKNLGIVAVAYERASA